MAAKFRLQNRTQQWIFVLSGIIAVVVAISTVSFQTWRAATRSPLMR